MTVHVKTKEELKKAIEARAAVIVIDDDKLAKSVRRFKALKRLSKWSLRIILIAGGIGAAGIALAPATGGGTLAVAGPMSIVVATQTGSSVTVSTMAAAAIVSLAILGMAVLYALWKDYDIEIEYQQGIPKHVRLMRRGKQSS